MTNILITVFALCFFFNTAMASDFLVVEGKLTDSSGLVPIEDPSVDFTLSIFGDTANNCLLYKETFSALDMSGTKGFFSLKLGKGSVVTGNFLNSMNNKINHTGLTCTTGTTYNPSATSFRKLEISYNNGSGLQTLSQRIDIGASQYANYAYSLEGKSSADFIQVNTASGKVLTQTNLENVFNNSSNYTELMALISGTSTQYNSGTPVASVDMNSQKIVNVAAPTLGTDATNKTYVDSKIGGVAVDNATIGALSVGQSGQVLTWNGTQWTSSAPSSVDATKLPLTGGTMSGALNMGNQDIINSKDLIVNNDLTVTNNVSVTGGIGVGTGINSNGTISIGPINVGAGNGGRLSLVELAANGVNSVSLRSPDNLAADLIFTLPMADGTSGQVLQTNGSGALSWASATSPVSSVFGRTGTVVSAASDYTATQVDNSPAGNIIATNVQAAINEIDTEKVAKSGDIMSGNLTIATTNELRLGDADDSHYIGFKAPAIVTAGASFAWELPPSDGTSGQVLQTDGSGVLSWVAQSSGGETNTASNQGAGGVGVYDVKSGADLQFRNINALNNKVSVALDAGNKEIDIGVNEANFNPAAIPNAPAGNIAATNIQAAINELDAEKISSVDGVTLSNGNLWIGNGINQAASVTMSGDATMSNTGTLSIANSSISSAKILDASIADIDINASAAIGRAKLANGTANKILINSGTGAMSEAATITPYRALASDVSGLPVHSAVTNVELGYLSGVTSAVQTQIDAKISTGGGAMLGALNIDNEQELRLSEADGNGTNYVGLKSPTALAANIVWTLPSADGTSGQVLQTNGSGTLSWSSPAGSDNLGSHIATTTLNMASNIVTNLQLGSATAPAISFQGDPNTGIYSSSPDNFSITTNGAMAVNIVAGNMGIGILSPQAKLDVAGAIKVGNISGAPTCTTAGVMQTNAPGNDLMICDGANWRTVSKKLPSALNNTSTFNFALNSMVYTANNCGAIALHNMADGQKYEAIIQGATSSTCSFTAFSDAGSTPLTVKMPNGHGATTVSSHTLYEFTVAGAFVYVKWSTGL